MPIRSFTDAEVLVSERRRLERPLVVVVWMGIALFSLAEGSAFFLVAGTVAAGVKLQAVSRGKELLLRRFLVTLGVLLATLLVVGALVLRAGDPVVSLGHYVILIQLCKLFERSRNRDYAQVLVMSVVTVMTACLFNDQLWFAVAVGAYLALACHTAMVLTLKRGLDAAVEASLPTESGPLPADKVAWNVRRDWPARPLRRALVPILLAMLATGTLFFLVAPRSGPQLAGYAPQSQKNIADTGYRGSVQLGDAKAVYLSDRVAMKVRLTTAAVRGADASAGGAPPSSPRRISGPLYFRGHVLENYAQSHWFSRRGGRSQDYIPARDLDPQRGIPPPPGVLRQQVHMTPGLLSTLFGVAPVLRVWAPVDLGAIHVGPQGEIRLITPAPLPEEWVEYVVESALAPQMGPLDPPPAAGRGEAGGEPEQTYIAARVRDQATYWCQDLLDRRKAEPNRREAVDLAIAQRLSGELRRAFAYSLDLSRCNPANDGVEDFLFNMKQGHCEYFASALTVMCRALGVRARLATGFRADDLSSPDGWALIRDRDAHAWTEVFSPRQGWLIYDATPAGSPAPVRQHWYSFLTDAWENAHQFWYQRIIRYSEKDRQDLLGIARGWYERCRGAVVSFAQGLWQGLQDLFLRGDIDKAIVELALALGVVAAVVEAWIMLHMIRRRTRLGRSLRQATGDRWQQARFLVQFLRLLERRGLDPRPQWTLLETAAHAADALGIRPQEARGLVQLYYRLRWGGADILPAEIQAAEQTVEAMRRATKGRRHRAPP